MYKKTDIIYYTDMMTNYYVIMGERRQLIFKFKQMNCGHYKS